MKIFSVKTFLEILNDTLVNVSSGWFGVILVAPGFFGVSSAQQYFELLIKNLPFAILGLIGASILSEKIKSL